MLTKCRLEVPLHKNVSLIKCVIHEQVARSFKEVALIQSVTESEDGAPSPAGRRLYQNIDLAQSPARVIDII